MIGIITGTGLYTLERLEGQEVLEITTRFGHATLTVGRVGERSIAHLARHGEGHALLPNMINYRANLAALAEVGARAIFGTTVCGILRPELPLARPLIFDDLFFMDNRLPDGSLCTIYEEPGDPRRGHLIGGPFSPGLRYAALQAAERLGLEVVAGGAYAQVNGPRFNTRTEIAFLRQLGVTAVSQTAAAEAVLAGELEIPYALIGFGVDYASGVKEPPTSPEELTHNLSLASKTLADLVVEAASALDPSQATFDTGFVYRFA